MQIDRYAPPTIKNTIITMNIEIFTPLINMSPGDIFKNEEVNDKAICKVGIKTENSRK